MSIAATYRRKPRLAAICTLLPVLATGYQIAAKSLADEARRGPAGGASPIDLLAHPMALLLLGCEIASFVIWIYVLAQMPLSEAFPMSALSYILVIAASHYLFDEPLTVAQLAGSGAIVLGAWLIGRGGPPQVL